MSQLQNDKEKLSARQAKRAAKAAERGKKSELLKEEGNTFFRKGDYQNAIDRYRQAIHVHGPSVKPILLTNLAAAYHNVGKFYEAHEAADEALTADPKSVKARYRRGMARKSMEMWSAAAIDFRIVLRLDPTCLQVVKELRNVEKCYEEDRLFLEGTGDGDSEDEAPALDDDPQLGESLSESSDCEHSGNGKPCRFYNLTECMKGRGCSFSHAPDYHSERDGLGRNVCKYYLMGLCKFGGRCSYLHSTEYLLQRGWWSTAEGIDKAKGVYRFRQILKGAAIDYEKQFKASPPVSKKKHSRGKKNGNHRARSDFGRSGSGVSAAASGNQSILAVSGQSSRRTNSNNQTKYAVDSYLALEGYDSDDGYGEDEYGIGMCGFTDSQVEELLCQGVKPWDDDAWDVMHVLDDAY